MNWRGATSIIACSDASERERRTPLRVAVGNAGDTGPIRFRLLDPEYYHRPPAGPDYLSQHRTRMTKKKPRLKTEASARPVSRSGFPAVRHRDPVGGVLTSAPLPRCAVAAGTLHGWADTHHLKLPPISELWDGECSPVQNPCCVMQLTCFDHRPRTRFNQTSAGVARVIIRMQEYSSVRQLTQAEMHALHGAKPLSGVLPDGGVSKQLLWDGRQDAPSGTLRHRWFSRIGPTTVLR